jgi:hypothetical protein
MPGTATSLALLPLERCLEIVQGSREPNKGLVALSPLVGDEPGHFFRDDAEADRGTEIAPAMAAVVSTSPPTAMAVQIVSQ